jgi:cytochrome c peroxidase
VRRAGGADGEHARAARERSAAPEGLALTRARRRARHRIAVALVCALAFAPATGQPPTLADADREAILAHGPWPPPWQRDPSNRVSGQPAAIAFGERLFNDRRLSASGALACATCHQPQRAFTDGLVVAHGAAAGVRNTPALANLRWQRWFGWDGAHDNLWAQSLRPIADAREMASDFSRLAALVRTDPDLAADYRSAFGAYPPAGDEALAVDVGKALAAYQETLVTARTPFDAYRDALARGDAAAAAKYPAAAARGARLFVGKGRCNVCHLGPSFTNGEFQDIGVPFFVAGGGVDSGRYDGIRRLQASRFNLLGPYSDDPSRSTATATRHVAVEHRNFGEFKVPSLREVARTPPYMHNGSLATLRDVVRHYSKLDLDRVHADGGELLRPLELSAAEIDDLVAFLESLSGEEAK